MSPSKLVEASTNVVFSDEAQNMAERSEVHSLSELVSNLNLNFGCIWDGFTTAGIH